MMAINERFEVNDRAVHISGNTNDWEVWVNTPVADFDGICVGGGVNRTDAIVDAVRTLELATARLRKLI